MGKLTNYTLPEMADEACVKEWANKMLRGHLGGHATTLEKLGNLFALQFKGVVDTMSHSLRIKEDSYTWFRLFCYEKIPVFFKVKTGFFKVILG